MQTIRVTSGGAPKEIFARLAQQFEQMSGHKVAFTYAVMSAIKDKLAAGEKTDILVMPVPLLDGYAKDGKLCADGRATLGIVGVSVVVRESAARPDISTREKLRQALLDARSVVHATPGATPSGTHMGKVMEQLGIAEAMAKKVIHRPALEGGVQMVAKGEAELGIYPTSEIVNIKGLRLVGPLPPGLEFNIVYGAAVTTDSAAPESAAAFIKFLTDPAMRKHWKEAGFDPPGN